MIARITACVIQSANAHTTKLRPAIRAKHKGMKRPMDIMPVRIHEGKDGRLNNIEGATEIIFCIRLFSCNFNFVLVH
jgi:hypothetical protein